MRASTVGRNTWPGVPKSIGRGQSGDCESAPSWRLCGGARYESGTKLAAPRRSDLDRRRRDLSRVGAFDLALPRAAVVVGPPGRGLPARLARLAAARGGARPAGAVALAERRGGPAPARAVAA